MPIRLLDAGAVAGISAGEVIERPASVAKELIENALDSGATRIRVDVQGGGLGLLRVTDNGCGIPPAEALLAFSRHATSKLTALDDLTRLTTFGFRGEALAAVAAAGDVELVTRTADGVEGVRVAGEAGEGLAVSPAGAERGTVISVRRLFRRMPARLKFLKQPSAESAAVARVLEPYALTRPDIHFILTIDGEERLNVAPGDALHRITSIIGAEGTTLIPFDLTEGAVRAHGVAEAPGSVRRRGRQWLLVNARPVEDRALRHALISSYDGQLPRDTQPYAVMFVDVPPDRVDVNVHPAKAEVRFADASQTYKVLHRALRTAFGFPAGSAAAGGGVAPGDPVSALFSAPGAGGAWAGEPVPPALGAAGQTGFPQTAGDPSGAAPVEVLGQLFSTYIAARVPEGLLLVDQHTAHEKIIFERITLAAGRPASQALLLPQRVELSPSEALLVQGHPEAFAALGFEFEAFGGGSLVVRGVPAEAADREVVTLLRWLLEDLEQAGRAPEPAERDRRLRASMACHLAVKAGDRLERAEMEAVVRGLLTLADPRTCPHGRPTFVRYEEAELARLFRRTWGLGKRECH